MGLFDYVNQGGSIMYLLLFVNIIGGSDIDLESRHYFTS